MFYFTETKTNEKTRSKPTSQRQCFFFRFVIFMQFFFWSLFNLIFIQVVWSDFIHNSMKIVSTFRYAFRGKVKICCETIAKTNRKKANKFTEVSRQKLGAFISIIIQYNRFESKLSLCKHD